MAKNKVSAVLGLLTGALVWGLIWYPYRVLEEHGLSGIQATLATYAVALLLALVLFRGELGGREHTDNLYGAILSWDGQPAAYQVERIGVLEADLKDIGAEFQKLLDSELPAVNKALEGAGMKAIEPPPAKVAAVTTRRGGGAQAGVEFDADAVGMPAQLPTSRIVLH